MRIKSFLHSGKLGDIIWSLPLIRYLGGGNLYLRINEFDPGANEYKLTQQSAESIVALLEQQPYITGVEIYDNQSIDYNLDLFRTKIFQIKTSIAGSFFHTFDLSSIDIDSELDRPWLSVTPNQDFKDKIVVSRTKRYLAGNETPNPFYLYLKEQNIAKHGVFLGTLEEYNLFEQQHNTGIVWHETKTVLEIAGIVAASKFYAGNENLINAINESLKKPVFLENQKNSASHFCLFRRPDQFII